MQVYLLSLLFILNTSLSKTPNFYPNFIAAREASKNYNKDLLIFFSKNSCANCDAAWTNFEKDPIASKLFISTSINIQDFDGAVLLDKYGLKNAPAWLVLDPQGQVKDKWEGEWKKTPTRPATSKPEMVQNEVIEKAETPVKEPKQPVVKEAAVVVPVAPAAIAIEEPILAAQKEQVPTMVVEEVTIETVVIESPAEEVAPVTKPASVTIAAPRSGFIIQAGFFGSEANAIGLVSDLNAKGFTHFSSMPTDRNGSTFHRVISTTYPSEAEAQVQVDKLKTVGINATIKNQKEL